MQSENYKIVCMLNKVADMVIVSVLWCVLCLPVITVGASTAALYYAVVKAVREDKAYVVSSFLSAFKKNFRQCTCFHAGALVCMLAFGSTVYGMYQFLGNFAANVYLVFSCLCFLVILTAQLHACFLIGRFEICGREFWSVLLRLCGNGIGNNVLMLSVFVFAAELVFWQPLTVLFVPAGAVFLLSFMEEKRFGKYIRYDDGTIGVSYDKKNKDSESIKV